MARETDILRLYEGPLKLPRIVTTSQDTIRLFMAYLGQAPTRAAILAVVTGPILKGNKATKIEVGNAIERLRLVGVPRNTNELCKLVARAVELKMVCRYARLVEQPDILPLKALIPDDVVEACLASYHDWVAALSRYQC